MLSSLGEINTKERVKKMLKQKIIRLSENYPLNGFEGTKTKTI